MEMQLLRELGEQPGTGIGSIVDVCSELCLKEKGVERETNEKNLKQRGPSEQRNALINLSQ